MTRRVASDITPDHYGFRVWRGSPKEMTLPHAHTDVEGNLLLRGSMTYLHGGRQWMLQPEALHLFWAGIPHRLVATSDDCELVWITLPLAWLVDWQPGEELIGRLLRGDFVTPGPGDPAQPLDRPLLLRWEQDLQRNSQDMRRIVLLEVEARIRRLALALSGSGENKNDQGTGTHVEKLAAFMASHYRQPLSVATIAAAAGLHPNYAMQLFKRNCGMPLWEYLLRLRISHAQRLLLTTDWKIQRIAQESGFATPSRFYEVFVRIGQCTPREYRRRIG